jgi:hypothetical protein
LHPFEIGRTEDGLAVWRLRIGKVEVPGRWVITEVPGRWVIIDGWFVPVEGALA